MIDIYSALRNNNIHITLEMLTYENIALFLLKGSLLLINVVFYGVLFSKIFLFMFERQINQFVNSMRIKLFGTAAKTLDELMRETVRMEIQLWKEHLEETYNEGEEQTQEEEGDGVCCEEINPDENEIVEKNDNPDSESHNEENCNSENEKVSTPVELNYKKDE
jgi:hypothetical protein